MLNQAFERTFSVMDRFERPLCLAFNRVSRRKALKTFFKIISRFGDGYFWALSIAIVIALRTESSLITFIRLVFVGATGILIYKSLKGKTLRHRPYVIHEDISLPVIPLDRYSFPSGHTLEAVAFTTVLMATFPVLGWLTLPFTVLVGISRIVLGLHYPTDVLAGATLGYLLARISFLIS